MKKKFLVLIGAGICLIIAVILVIAQPGINQNNPQGEVLHREEFTSEKEQSSQNPSDVDNDSAFIQN